MIKKKYLLLGGLFATLAAGPAFAQESGNTTGGTTTGATYSSRDMTYRGESYDVLDTSYVPGRRMEQHRKFLNHQTNFPAKPRNMWEIGVSFGLFNVSGDVPSLMLWHKGGYGFGAHLRKALGYVGSLRLDYNYGIGKGLQWQPSMGYQFNPAWNGDNWNAPGAGYKTPIFYNYRTEVHQLNLDVVLSLGNILFHHTRTKVDPYVFGGIGANAYQTWVNSLKSDYTKYDFTPILAKYGATGGNFQYSDRDHVRKDLQSLFDDSYETNAETDRKTRRPTFFNSKKLSFVTSFGAGLQYRISRRLNIAIEDRVTFYPTTNEDLLDGQHWDENTKSGVGVPSQNKDGINYLSLGVNFNLGGGSRNVEPLYWLNPLDYSYGELATPRHMVLPEPVLPDSDGDGIADQFDKCPGTPAGVAVDSHGCPMDTDGDGVPDDRDKQLITPTECQPVDADGVGKCPCHCEGLTKGGPCTNIAPGSITFSTGSSKISPAMQAQLATLAAQMQASPDCRIVVEGNAGGSKVAQQRSWDRVNAVIEYMSEKHNIDRNRFIFRYQGAAGENNVTYRAANAGEEGPSNEAPPHPDLRR
jgi:outer membrane protein OmpA-like peptidoglycan-associated protein